MALRYYGVITDRAKTFRNQDVEVLLGLNFHVNIILHLLVFSNVTFYLRKGKML